MALSAEPCDLSNKTDGFMQKMRVLASDGSCYFHDGKVIPRRSAAEFRPEEKGTRDDYNQNLHQWELSGLRSRHLHRSYAMRFLSVGSEGGAKEYRTSG